jgi:hypothetical protein
VNPYAARVDIGSEEIWACVPEDRDPQPVRSFGTFTPDLYALVEWLTTRGIKTVAMESTGMYWIPVYEVLEARGFQVHLVNARHLKHVPGGGPHHVERGMGEEEAKGLWEQEVIELLAESYLRLTETIPFVFGLNRLYVAEKDGT